MTVIANPRLKAHTFRLPIEKIRAGYKTDTYFNRTKYILEQDNKHLSVTMQVFQKVPDAVVCGVDHTLAILASGTGYYSDPYEAEKLFSSYRATEQQVYKMWRNKQAQSVRVFMQWQRHLYAASLRLDELWVDCFKDLEIEALYDGETIGAREPVMLIRGNLSTFVHLETIYLGALTDGTMVATNTRDVVEAASGKPILMFGARHQAAESQAGSGYAAHIGGATGVSTDEQGEYWGAKGHGTIPHVLIAAYDGNTVMATEKFDQYIDENVVRISLVDFDNNSVRTSLEVARSLGDRLGAVRLDTSENMVDMCLQSESYKGDFPRHLRGVNSALVQEVRAALDREGFPYVGIFVSGGFNKEKIAKFEEWGVPVVGYGVGSGLFDRRGGKFEYTADVVEPVAKTGRGLWSGPELHRVTPSEII